MCVQNGSSCLILTRPKLTVCVQCTAHKSIVQKHCTRKVSIRACDVSKFCRIVIIIVNADSFATLQILLYTVLVDAGIEPRTVSRICCYNHHTTSNGKTSLVHYRTLSFFAFRFKKKRKFAFFPHFKCKISIEPVRFASILVQF